MSAINLQQIEAQVSRNIAAGLPTFQQTILAAAQTRKSLLSFFDSHHFELVHTEVEANEHRYRIVGQTDDFMPVIQPFKQATFECIFLEVDQHLSFELRASLPSSANLAIPGVDAIEINELVLHLVLSGLDDGLDILHVVIGGTLKIGSQFTFPCKLEIPAQGDNWVLIGDFDRLKFASLADLNELLGSSSFLEPLPQAIREFNQLFLTQFLLEFSPKDKQLKTLSLGVECDQTWSLVPNQLQLADIALYFNLSAAGAGRLPFSLSASANIRKGSTCVPVSFTLDSSTNIDLEMPPGYQLQLSQLNDLQDLMGGGILPGVSLPTIDPAHSPCLSGLALKISQGNLERLQGTLYLPGCWTLLPDTAEICDTELNLAVINPFTSARDLQASISGWMQIADTTLPLEGQAQASQIELNVLLPQLDLQQTVRQYLPTAPSNLPQVIINGGNLVVSKQQGLDLVANTQIRVTDFIEVLGIPVPDFLADISIDHIIFQANPVQGQANFELSISADLQIPCGHGNHLNLREFKLRLYREPHMGAGVACEFNLSGQLKISPELFLSLPEVQFRYDSQGFWQVQGKVEAQLFELQLDLNAVITQDEQGSRLQLLYRGDDIFLCDWEGVGYAQLKNLGLSLSKNADHPDQASYSLDGDLQLHIEGLFDTQGRLQLESGPSEMQLRAILDVPETAPIPLLPGDSNSTPLLHLNCGDLQLSYASGQKKNNWSLSGDTQFWLSELPHVMVGYFPTDPADAKISLGSDGLIIETRSLNFEAPKLPPLSLKLANDHELRLGVPAVSIEAIRFSIGRREKGLSADLHFTLPTELNYLLGWDQQGQPNHRFMNDSFDARLSLRKAPTLQLRSSPLQGLSVYQQDGKWWSDWEFGQYASFSFQTPEISYRKGRWQCALGMKRRGPLKLPLAPVKFALAQIGVKEYITRVLPDAIELREIDLESPDFYQQVQFALGSGALGHLDPKLENLLSELINLISAGVQRLPEDLQDYFRIKVPQSLSVEMALGPGGSTSFGIATQDDEPLQFLLPGVSPFGPTLFGLTFYRISLGQMLGGNLALVELNGHFDQFDLPMLIGAVAQGEAGLSLRNRVTCEDVMIVAPTGLPVPIPLFYTKLAWDLRNFIGLEIHTHWAYPKPDPSIFGLVQLFRNMLSYFTQPKTLLHKQPQPPGLALKFTVGQNLIVLPKYLGGGSLGLEQPLPPLNVYESTSRLLDSMKTGNLGYLITAIPLQIGQNWCRIGAQRVSLGPLYAEAAWCITTEQEFRYKILPNKSAMQLLEHAGGDEVLNSLPQGGRKSAAEHGFILLLMGGAGIGSVAASRLQIGLAFTRDHGFQTGFQLMINIADALALKLGGVLQIDEHGLSADGHCGLYLNDNPLFAVKVGIAIKDTYFETHIRFDIDRIGFGGALRISNDGVTMSGFVDWDYGGDKLSQIEGFAEFSQQGMRIGFTSDIYGNQCEVAALIGGPYRSPVAQISLVLSNQLQQSLVDHLQELGKDIRNEVNELSNEIDQIDQDARNLIISVSRIRDLAANKIVEVADKLPSIIRPLVIKYIDDYVEKNVPWGWPGGWIRKSARKVAKPIKRGVSKKVSSELRGVIKDLHNKAKNIRQSDPDAAKALMLAELRDTLRTYREYTYAYKIRLGVPKVKTWTIRYPYTYRMPQELQDLINNAIKGLEQLDATRKYEIDRKHLRGVARQKQAILDGIEEGIEKDVAQAIPQLKYMRVETGLGRFNAADMQMSVGVTYQGKTVDFSVQVNLDNVLGQMGTVADKTLAELA